MPHNLDLIFTLTGGLTAALFLGYVTQRLRLSPIVGYLLAGVFVGPFTPGFVAHGGIAEQLAELGVILLMFGVGLQFHMKELLAVKGVAIPGAVAQSAVATLLGALLATAFGWSWGAGVVFGLAISVASTVVLIRVLSDNDELHTKAGHVAVGWLVVEDLFTVLVLVMLPVVAQGGESGEFVQSVGLAVVKIGALVAFTLIFGRRLIPKLLDHVARTRSRELFTLTVLVLALGIAVGSAKLFGASMALGAFLAGIVVGQSDFSSRAASEALPMRDAFAVLFFVSMGMLFDPGQLLPNLPLTLLTFAIVLIAKPLAALAVVLLLKRPPKVAAAVAVALAQIGEFSFILAALGRSLDILPAEATQVLVAVAVASITLNPLVFRVVPALTRALEKLVRSKPELEAEPSVEGHEIIIVGYGPVGRLLARLLRENGIDPLILELNHETVNTLKKDGLAALYGDASQPEILRLAGVAQARALIFAAATPPGPVIRAAKEQNPDLLVITRATYASETTALANAGAAVSTTAEVEVAFSMVEKVLASLGATGEQIDRARERARSELLVPVPSAH
jgi:CPA2 family monovalent cation:H+ antiporter-2